jgi:hypothetical protein
MGYAIKTVYTETLGPKDAVQWLEAFAYPKQRPLRRDHVRTLRGSMLDGTWVAGTMLKLVEIGDAIYLVDGQHRLKALTEQDGAHEFVVAEYTADTLDDVGTVYGHTDHNQRSRSFGVYMDAMDVSANLGMTRMHIDALSGSLALILTGGTGDLPRSSSPSLEERKRLIELYAPFVRKTITAIGSMSGLMNQPMRRSYVQAFMALTSRYPITAGFGDRTTEAFWTGMVADDGLAATDPRKLVHTHLLTSKVAGRSLIKNTKEMVTSTGGFRLLTLAYNAYIEGRSLKFLRVNGTGEEALTILGVPKDADVWIK